jgi:hypothetical protein
MDYIKLSPPTPITIPPMKPPGKVPLLSGHRRSAAKGKTKWTDFDADGKRTKPCADAARIPALFATSAVTA